MSRADVLVDADWAEAHLDDPKIVFVEVDAEQHLDLVRRLDVRKTPTTLVLDARGAVTTRAAGPPRKADVSAALGKAVPS